MIIGGIEMTNGCNAASLLSIDIIQKLPVISSIIAFGGLCIQMQTKAVCADARLVPKHFVLAKSLQAFFSYIICVISLVVFPSASVTGDITASTKMGAYFGIVLIALIFVTPLIFSPQKVSRLFGVPRRKPSVFGDPVLKKAVIRFLKENKLLTLCRYIPCRI